MRRSRLEALEQELREAREALNANRDSQFEHQANTDASFISVNGSNEDGQPTLPNHTDAIAPAPIYSSHGLLMPKTLDGIVLDSDIITELIDEYGPRQPTTLLSLQA